MLFLSCTSFWSKIWAYIHRDSLVWRWCVCCGGSAGFLVILKAVYDLFDGWTRLCNNNKYKILEGKDSALI